MKDMITLALSVLGMILIGRMLMIPGKIDKGNKKMQEIIDILRES